MKMALYTYPLLLALVALQGCSQGPLVTIENRSGMAISNVVVSGSIFTNKIECIKSGAEVSLAVHPRGESGLCVIFDSGNRHIDSGEQGYFEANGNRIRAIVETNLNVKMGLD